MGIFHLFIDFCLYESNIQHSMLALYKGKNYLPLKKLHEPFPTIMLAYLMINNIFDTAVQMEEIANMKCKLHRPILEQVCFEQKIIKNC